MNDYWYCLASKAIAVAGFCTMAINGRPWWGLVCFAALAFLGGELKPSGEATGAQS